MCKESFSHTPVPGEKAFHTAFKLYSSIHVPANFFWNIGLRFFILGVLGFLKTTQWRKRKQPLHFPSPSLRTHANASSLRVLFTSKIRDRKEGIVIYSFYTWFSFLTWVWVHIFLEIVSSKTATTHIFQSGVRNWPASVSRCEIKVFNPQAWDSRLRHESSQVYSIVFYLTWLNAY